MAARAQTDETLADLLVIAQRRHDVHSGRALALLAADLGHEVSHTTLNKILAGREGGQSLATVDAIAALAGVSRTRAHAAAGRPVPGRPFIDEIPAEADLLSRRQRDAVLGVIRAFVELADGATEPVAPLRGVARRRKP